MTHLNMKSEDQKGALGRLDVCVRAAELETAALVKIKVF